MSFMNWKNDNTNLYQVLNYLEHEWYVGDEQLWKEPPLPFSYHNWLIDPNYKWEDMSKPKSELAVPQESLRLFKVSLSYLFLTNSLSAFVNFSLGRLAGLSFCLSIWPS